MRLGGAPRGLPYPELSWPTPATNRRTLMCRRCEDNVASMMGIASLSVLRQLCNLRWIAVAGQAITVALVITELGVPLPRGPMWLGIGVLTLFNLYATWHTRRAQQASEVQVALHILVDIVVLAWLVGFSGGMENPFASLFLMPLALSILVLPTRLMAFTALASIAGYLVSTLFGRELPPVPGLSGGTF